MINLKVSHHCSQLSETSNVSTDSGFNSSVVGAHDPSLIPYSPATRPQGLCTCFSIHVEHSSPLLPFFWPILSSGTPFLTPQLSNTVFLSFSVRFPPVLNQTSKTRSFSIFPVNCELQEGGDLEPLLSMPSLWWRAGSTFSGGTCMTQEQRDTATLHCALFSLSTPPRPGGEGKERNGV